MMVHIRKQSRQVLYKQIVEQLRQQILSGEMPPDLFMPCKPAGGYGRCTLHGDSPCA